MQKPTAFEFWVHLAHSANFSLLKMIRLNCDTWMGLPEKGGCRRPRFRHHGLPVALCFPWHGSCPLLLPLLLLFVLGIIMVLDIFVPRQFVVVVVRRRISSREHKGRNKGGIGRSRRIVSFLRYQSLVAVVVRFVGTEFYRKASFRARWFSARCCCCCIGATTT